MHAELETKHSCSFYLLLRVWFMKMSPKIAPNDIALLHFSFIKIVISLTWRDVIGFEIGRRVLPISEDYIQTTFLWLQKESWQELRTWCVRANLNQSSVAAVSSAYNSTETVSWLSRNLRKAPTLFRWSCQLIHEFQCRSTKYFNFKSVDLRMFICSHTRESPHWRQATIQTFRFNELNPERLSWKPHFVQFWCGRAICRRQIMTYNRPYAKRRVLIFILHKHE